jgi:hypothetical protein
MRRTTPTVAHATPSVARASLIEGDAAAQASIWRGRGLPKPGNLPAELLADTSLPLNISGEDGDTDQEYSPSGQQTAALEAQSRQSVLASSDRAKVGDQAVSTRTPIGMHQSQYIPVKFGIRTHNNALAIQIKVNPARMAPVA